MKFKDNFVENEFYHIYNRTNNKELLFKNDDCKYFFLNRYDHYCSNFLDTYSWNLLPNHFHILAKVKSIENISGFLEEKPPSGLCKTERRFLKNKTTVHNLIDNVLRRFSISYSMSFNAAFERAGNLFYRPFKHVLLADDSQFTQTVIYINANAQKHKLVKDFRNHKWSSYHTLISDKPTKLARTDLLDWFGGKARFIKDMEEQTKYYYACESIFEID